jgi:hypothetical protein
MNSPCLSFTHRIAPALAPSVALALSLSLSCGNSGSPNDSGNDYNPVIDPADFVSGITNPYVGFTPGKKLVYSDGGSERIEILVTHETKVILGVTCIVVHDQVFDDGELIEDTYDWYAEDKDGNVWYFGEDTKEYEEGVVVSTEGSWKGGVDDAKPGIFMKGSPEVGASYRQEYYEGEAEDMAEVTSLTASVSIGYGNYTSCLETKEWTPLEPGVQEYKFYASGVGLVLESPSQAGTSGTELIEVTTGN